MVSSYLTSTNHFLLEPPLCGCFVWEHYIRYIVVQTTMLCVSRMWAVTEFVNIVVLEDLLSRRRKELFTERYVVETVASVICKAGCFYVGTDSLCLVSCLVAIFLCN